MASEFSDAAFTVKFMEAGGCGKEFMAAGHKCQKAADGGSRDDLHACITTTSAVRKCMAANQTFFQPFYIGALDAGIEENEKQGYGGVEFAEDENKMLKWRWWCNMRRQ